MGGIYNFEFKVTVKGVLGANQLEAIQTAVSDMQRVLAANEELIHDIELVFWTEAGELSGAPDE